MVNFNLSSTFTHTLPLGMLPLQHFNMNPISGVKSIFSSDMFKHQTLLILFTFRSLLHVSSCRFCNIPEMEMSETAETQVRANILKD